MSNKVDPKINCNFFSDTNAPAHPSVMESIMRRNLPENQEMTGYGDDNYTFGVYEKVKALFSPSNTKKVHDIAFVATGTAANTIAIMKITQPRKMLFCEKGAHITTDESSAVCAVGGIFPIEVDDIYNIATWKDNEYNGHYTHGSRLKTVSLSIPDSLGRVPSLDELKQLHRFTQHNNIKIHIDGARLSNAAVALGIEFAEFGTFADTISFGLSKNSAMNAECVLSYIPNDTIDDREHFYELVKSLGQRQAKSWIQAAQFDTVLFETVNGLPYWKAHAEATNLLAKQFETEIKGLSTEIYRIAFRVQTNMVFLSMSGHTFRKYNNTFGQHFHECPKLETRDGRVVVRIVFSWNHKYDDMKALVERLKKVSD